MSQRTISTKAAAAGATPAPESGATPAAVPGKEDVSGPMLEPSLANNPLVRLVTIAGVTAAAASGTPYLPARALAFVHLTAFALFLGSTVWNTFFVGLTLFANLPRQTFGRVQSKLFPKYFSFSLGCNVVLLATLVVGGAALATQPAIIALSVALGCGLTEMILEPFVTKLMFERYEIENLPEKSDADLSKIKSLYKKFGMWHGISSLVNLIMLLATIVYGWYLAGGLTM